MKVVLSNSTRDAGASLLTTWSEGIEVPRLPGIQEQRLKALWGDFQRLKAAERHPEARAALKAYERARDTTPFKPAKSM